jgi:hypothetical protein
MARPSAMRSAVSKLSARRCCSPGCTRSRSTTTSMSCFSFFFSLGSALASYTVPGWPFEPMRKRT